MGFDKKKVLSWFKKCRKEQRLGENEDKVAYFVVER